MTFSGNENALCLIDDDGLVLAFQDLQIGVFDALDFPFAYVKDRSLVQGDAV